MSASRSRSCTVFISFSSLILGKLCIKQQQRSKALQRSLEQKQRPARPDFYGCFRAEKRWIVICYFTKKARRSVLFGTGGHNGLNQKYPPNTDSTKGTWFRPVETAWSARFMEETLNWYCSEPGCGIWSARSGTAKSMRRQEKTECGHPALGILPRLSSNNNYHANEHLDSFM